MKSTFAIAAFAGVAVAAPQNAHKQIRPNGKLGNDQGFLQFMGVFNQHASTQDKFETMQANYHNEMNNINNANRYCDEVDRSARCPRQKVNFTMGMTAEEKQQLLGLRSVPEEKKQKLSRRGEGRADGNQRGNNGRNRGNRGGRGLQTIPDEVDHAADGWMGPIKNQGNCGSCVQFAVSSAMEGALAKAENMATTPRFSEQHLLDCTYGDDASYPAYV